MYPLIKLNSVAWFFVIVVFSLALLARCHVAEADVIGHFGTSLSDQDSNKIAAVELTTGESVEGFGIMMGTAFKNQTRTNEFIGAHWKWNFIKDLMTFNAGGSYWNNELRGDGGNFQFYAAMCVDQFFKIGPVKIGSCLDHWSNGRSAFGRDTVNSNPSRTALGVTAAVNLGQL